MQTSRDPKNPHIGTPPTICVQARLHFHVSRQRGQVVGKGDVRQPLQVSASPTATVSRAPNPNSKVMGVTGDLAVLYFVANIGESNDEEERGWSRKWDCSGTHTSQQAQTSTYTRNTQRWVPMGLGCVCGGVAWVFGGVQHFIPHTHTHTYPTHTHTHTEVSVLHIPIAMAWVMQ